MRIHRHMFDHIPTGSLRSPLLFPSTNCPSQLQPVCASNASAESPWAFPEETPMGKVEANWSRSWCNTLEKRAAASGGCLVSHSFAALWWIEARIRFLFL